MPATEKPKKKKPAGAPAPAAGGSSIAGSILEELRKLNAKNDQILDAVSRSPKQPKASRRGQNIFGEEEE